MDSPRTSKTSIAQRLFPLFALSVLAGALTACDGQAPSEIAADHYVPPSPQAQADAIGEALGVTQPKPAQTAEGEAWLSVHTAPLAYSDAGLMISLEGQAFVAEHSTATLAHTRWQQTSGPEALLLNPGELSAQAILPDVQSPTFLEFALRAADSEARVAEARTRVRVLPIGVPRLAANVAISRVEDQAFITLALAGITDTPVTIEYFTRDGTALAGEDYVFTAGQVVLDNENPETEFAINILSRELAVDDLFFTLHYSTDHRELGQQQSYVILRGDLNNAAILASKPHHWGDLGAAQDNLPGTTGDMRVFLRTTNSQTLPELSVTDPCGQRLVAFEEAPLCQGSSATWEDVSQEDNMAVNLYWASPIPDGRLSASLSNDSDQAIDYELHVAWGNYHHYLTGTLAANTAHNLFGWHSAHANLTAVTTDPDEGPNVGAKPVEGIPCAVNPSSELPSCMALQTAGNPFEQAAFYIDSDYIQHIRTTQNQFTNNTPVYDAMSLMAEQPTGIWLDSLAMLEAGDPATGRSALRQHLEQATEQQIARGDLAPKLVQLILSHNPIPIGLDEELGLGYEEEDLRQYKAFIDTIKSTIEEYPNLRVVAVLEPNTTPELIKSCVSDLHCQRREDANQLIYYTVKSFAQSQAANIYTYVAIGHSAWMIPSAQVKTWLFSVFHPSELNWMRGFATNTAAYLPTFEPLVIDGSGPRSFIDELTYINAVKKDLDAEGIQDVGFIIDTSRNGWGGPNRPTLEGGYPSRIDRRQSPDHWCNVSGAGIGERPRPTPLQDLPHIDAYTWLKQPGISDGDLSLAEGTDEENIHPCDPQNGDALANAPPGGHWFEQHFLNLIENAWPPIIEPESVSSAEFISLQYQLPEEHTYGTDGIEIHGEIAPGADITHLQVHLNGQEADLQESAVSVSNNSFRLAVSSLPLDDLSNTHDLYEDILLEIRVTATDASGMVTQGVLGYSSATNAKGSTGSDLIVYSPSRTAIASFSGNDILIPQRETSYASNSLQVGDGDNLVHFYDGAVHTGSGNNRLVYLDNGLGNRASVTGGSGNNTYLFARGGQGPTSGTLTITELENDAQAQSEVHFKHYTPEDISNIQITPPGFQQGDLTITFSNGPTLIVRAYLNPQGEFNNTIALFKFADGSVWDFAEIYQLVFD